MADENHKKRLLSVLLQNPDDLTAIQELFVIYKRQGQLNFSYFELINKADAILEYYQNRFNKTNEDKLSHITFSHRIIYPKYIFIERHNEYDTKSKLNCILFDLDAERGKLSPQRMAARDFTKSGTVSLYGPLEGQPSLYEIPCHTLYLNGASNLDLDKFNSGITKLSLIKCKEVRYSDLLRSSHSSILYLEISESGVTDITDFVEYFINISECQIKLTIKTRELIDLSPLLKLKEYIPRGKRFNIEISYLTKAVKNAKKTGEQITQLTSEIPDFSDKIHIVCF